MARDARDLVLRGCQSASSALKATRLLARLPAALVRQARVHLSPAVTEHVGIVVIVVAIFVLAHIDLFLNVVGRKPLVCGTN